VGNNRKYGAEKSIFPIHTDQVDRSRDFAGAYGSGYVAGVKLGVFLGDLFTES
jgi:hypothetical protein